MTNASDLWERWGLPDRLDGWTVLDVGCWEGRMCVEALNRGAGRVVGVDLCTCDELARNVAEYGFEFVQADATGETMLALGRFDLVICAGVLYHTPHPMMLLNRLRAATAQICMIETLVSADILTSADPLSKSENAWIEGPALEVTPWHGDASVWFAPNLGGFARLLDLAGFDYEIGGKGNRASATCYPIDITLSTLAPRRAGRLTLDGGTRA